MRSSIHTRPVARPLVAMPDNAHTVKRPQPRLANKSPRAVEVVTSGSGGRQLSAFSDGASAVPADGTCAAR
jgi:hypothetical protein